MGDAVLDELRKVLRGLRVLSGEVSDLDGVGEVGGRRERVGVSLDFGGIRGLDDEDGDGEAVVVVDEKLGEFHGGHHVAHAWRRDEH